MTRNATRATGTHPCSLFTVDTLPSRMVRTTSFVLRNSNVPNTVRANKRNTFVTQFSFFLRGPVDAYIFSVITTKLTRETAENVSICPTLSRIYVISVVQNVAKVFMHVMTRSMSGVHLTNNGNTCVIRQIFVIITAVVRTSVSIGAGFLTVLGS